MSFSQSILPAEGSGQCSYVTEEVKGLYSLDLPDYLEKTSDLNATASLQYRNLKKKLLVIVIDEEKSMITGLHVGFKPLDYYDYIAKQIAQKLEDVIIEKPSVKDLGKFDALQGGIDGKFLGTPLRYILEVVESKTHYYQIICWTEEGSINDVGNDIHLIINSFKELK